MTVSISITINFDYSEVKNGKRLNHISGILKDHVSHKWENQQIWIWSCHKVPVLKNKIRRLFLNKKYSIQTDQKFGRPISVWTCEKVDTVHNMIISDWWIRHWVLHINEIIKLFHFCEINFKIPGQKSTERVLASAFWDNHDVILIDYLDMEETIREDRYLRLLIKMRENIYEKSAIHLHTNSKLQ